jgi:hypothetical protein
MNAPTATAVSTSMKAVLGVAAALYMGAAGAAPEAALLVGATVLARATLGAAAQPATLVVSAQDVRQGYVDSPAPTRLLVSSNDPSGFAIDIWPVSELFTAIRLRGADVFVTLGRDGGTIVERSRRGRLLPMSLAWRFELAPGTLPGVYPWPLQVSVRPLGR